LFFFSTLIHVIQVTQLRTQQQQQQHDAGVSELAIDRGVDTSVGADIRNWSKHRQLPGQVSGFRTVILPKTN
jgi:hypothetical protein